MKHDLPKVISDLLDQWSYLGFTTKLQAAEFILANKDWNTLIKDTVFTEEDVERVNNWRAGTIFKETVTNK